MTSTDAGSETIADVIDRLTREALAEIPSDGAGASNFPRIMERRRLRILARRIEQALFVLPGIDISALIREAVDEEAQSVVELRQDYPAAAVRARLRELGERILRDVLSQGWSVAARRGRATADILPGADDMAPAELRDSRPQHPLYPPALRGAVNLVMDHTPSLVAELDGLRFDAEAAYRANVILGTEIRDRVLTGKFSEKELAEIGFAARKALYAEQEPRTDGRAHE